MAWRIDELETDKKTEKKSKPVVAKDDAKNEADLLAWSVDELVTEKVEEKPKPVSVEAVPEAVTSEGEPETNTGKEPEPVIRALPKPIVKELPKRFVKELPKPVGLPKPVASREQPKPVAARAQPEIVARTEAPEPVWHAEEPKAHKEPLKPVWRKEEPKTATITAQPEPAAPGVEPELAAQESEPESIEPVALREEPKPVEPVALKEEPKPVTPIEEPKPFQLGEEPAPVARSEEPRPAAKTISISPDKVQFRWKIVVCGAGGVGKSTLLHRYFYNEFLPDMIMTIGVSHMSHVVERQGKYINLIIWDLSGQKRFEVLHPAYVGDSTGAMVVFDMSQPETLDEVNKWVEMIRKFNPNNRGLPIVIVGTKIDLVSDQAYLDKIYKRIEEKMQELDLQYLCVTSSKTGYNIDETVNFLIDYLIFQQNLV